MHRIVIGMILMGTAIVLTGCDAPTTPERQPPPPPPPERSPSVPQVPEPPSPDLGCIYSHPHRLELQTDDYTEFQYLEDLVVCGNDEMSEARFTNASDVVWAFYGGGAGALVTPLDVDLQSDMLRDSIPPHQRAIAAPNDTVLLQAATLDGLSEFEWQIDADWTMHWMLQNALAEGAQDAAQDAAVEVFGAGSAARTAVATCAAAGVAAGQVGVDLANGEEAVSSAFEAVRDSGECATAWSDAEHAAANRRVPPLDVSVSSAQMRAPAMASSLDDVARWVPRLVRALPGGP